MAQGDKKRTYKLTDEGVGKLDAISEKSKLDKSDSVDRALKLYYTLLIEGKIDDPYVDGDDVGDWRGHVDGKVDGDGGGILDKFK